MVQLKLVISSLDNICIDAGSIEFVSDILGSDYCIFKCNVMEE